MLAGQPQAYRFFLQLERDHVELESNRFAESYQLVIARLVCVGER